MWKMQTGSARSNLVVGEASFSTALMNSLSYCESVERTSQNHAIHGLAAPLVLGEAMDSFSRNSDDLVGDFTTVGSYPQISCVVDRVPLIRSISPVVDGRFEDRERIVNSGTFCGTDYSSGVTDSVSCHESIGRSLSKRTIAPEVDGTVVVKNGGFQPGSCSLPVEWTMAQHRGLNCNSPGFSRFSNELLPFNIAYRNSMREQGSEISSSSGTMFLQAMQEILAEIALYTLESIRNGDGANSSDSTDPDYSLVFQDSHHVDKTRKKRLLALLQLVDDRYSQCLHEIHTVSSAFHAVTELDPNLHARFVLPTVSSMYKNLREKISSHIVPIGTRLPWQETDQSSWSVEQQWAFQQQLSKRERHLWRPHRGLPEQSVSVLRTWMFQNFLHPYPKDADKHLLALRSGLTRNQVSNWFINARVRLWKPMIEEMYAELNKRKQSTK